jgi:hypothetical protein
MANLWRQQLLQQLQDNMYDDEVEELFFVGTIHMFASDIIKAPKQHGGSAPWRSKNLPKIGNKAMSESTTIILHLYQCLEKFYSNTSIG